jgi:hypothetical protein
MAAGVHCLKGSGETEASDLRGCGTSGQVAMYDYATNNQLANSTFSDAVTKIINAHGYVIFLKNHE